MKRILRQLERAYGPRPWQRWGEGRAGGVAVLVETILSQSTSAANSEAGFRRLRRRFRSWNQVADAPVEEVEASIRVSGLSRQKAPRIQQILRQIRQERGKIDLEFLRDRPPAEAVQYLLAFKGVGPKTAHCVLLFAFQMPLFPVDRHIHRIARRRGLVPPRCTAEEAHELLGRRIAPADRYAMHVLLIAHGRKVCRPRRPKCGECCLRGRCGRAGVRRQG